VPLSAASVSLFSTLRLVPANLDSDGGDLVGDLDDATLRFVGGVPRTEGTSNIGLTSGVADRLPCACSVRNLAARVFVEAIASA